MLEYQRLVIPHPVLGLNTTDNPTTMDKRFTPHIFNMEIEPTLLRKRAGFTQLGQNLPLSGIGREIVSWIDGVGTEHLFAFTTTHIYKYDATNDLWKIVNPGIGQIDDCDDNWTFASHSGSELLTNGTFTSTLDPWTGNREWSAVGDAALWTADGINETLESTAFSVTAGKRYRLSITITASSVTHGSTLTVWLGDPVISEISAPDTYTVDFTPISTTQAVFIVPDGALGDFITIDNVSVVEVDDESAFDTSNEVEGTGCLSTTIYDTISSATKVAYTADFDPVKDLTSNTKISFWVKSTKALAANSFSLVVSEASAGAKSGTYVTIPNSSAIAANVWTLVEETYSPTNLNAVLSLGLWIDDVTATSADPVTIYIDDIRTLTLFTGTVEDRWSYTNATNPEEFSNGGCALIVSNNTDGLFFFDGTTDSIFQTLTPSDDITSLGGVSELIEFWNYLAFMNYSSGGLYRVNSLLYHNLEDADYVDKTVDEVRLTDSIGSLLRAKKLGYDLVLYSNSTITVGQYVGGTTGFVFPTLIYDTGLLYAKGLNSIANVHYLVTTDKRLVAYTGGTTLTNIGLPIQGTFFDFDTSRKYLASVSYVQSKDKLYYMLPQNQDYPVDFFAFNFNDNPQSWEAGQLGKSMMDCTTFSVVSSLACNSAYFTVATRDTCDGAELVLFSCDDGTTKPGYASTVFISGDGYVYQFENNSTTDDGLPITCEVDTFELTGTGESADMQTRFGEFDLECRTLSPDMTVKVNYSTNGIEGPWTALADENGFEESPIPTGNIWQYLRFPCDILARSVIFRVRQETPGNFEIRSRSALVEHDSER